jgi:hypothetical protein
MNGSKRRDPNSLNPTAATLGFEAQLWGAANALRGSMDAAECNHVVLGLILSGRVTAKQINDAVQDALASGILEEHVLGWAIEANVGEVKSALEKRGRVKVELIMIRPDTLAEGLKATQPETLFSPLALPDVDVKVRKNGKNGPEATVTLKGVALFDRKHRRTEYNTPTRGISPPGTSTRTTTATASWTARCSSTSRRSRPCRSSASRCRTRSSPCA